MAAEQQWVQLGAVLLVWLGFAAAEHRRGQFLAPQATAGDARLDAVMTLALPLVAGAVTATGMAASAQLWPEHRGAWAHWPWWAQVLTLLVADDFTQYLWHRLSHTSVLWPLHRAHHSAAYMSVRVVYRNNLLYYALMPGLWLSSVLLYLGFGWVYVAYAVVKVTVIMGAHSAVRWDAVLYRTPLLRPLAWVLERTISTPATHFAHHALAQGDGIGHYQGNYGNLLFLWDVLLGTAHFSRRYPPAVGLADDRVHGQEHWLTQIAFPLRRSTRAQTVLGWGEHRAPTPDQ